MILSPVCFASTILVRKKAQRPVPISSAPFRKLGAKSKISVWLGLLEWAQVEKSKKFPEVYRDPRGINLALS
jgi:hypothetical protein